MKKIAIAGPGRSGTSFLVQLCDAWGLSVPSGGVNWNETAQAGLESRIGGDSPFDVDKDPWAFNYIDSLTDDQLAQYSVMLVPIRNLRHAAVSRSVQERFSRMASGDLDQWAWESWGVVAGGAIYDTSVSGVESVLQKGLWRLLEVASRRGLPSVILNFPRIVEDFDYLWAQVGPFVASRVSEKNARTAWKTIAQVDKVRIRETSSSMDSDELQAIVRQQISRMDTLTRERDVAVAARDVAVAERNAMQSSRSWRYTRSLRSSLSAWRRSR